MQQRPPLGCKIHKGWFSKSHTIKRKCHVALTSCSSRLLVCLWYRFGLICRKLLKKDIILIYIKIKPRFFVSVFFVVVETNLSACLQMAGAQNNPHLHPRWPRTYLFYTFSTPTLMNRAGTWAWKPPTCMNARVGSMSRSSFWSIGIGAADVEGVESWRHVRNHRCDGLVAFPN